MAPVTHKEDFLGRGAGRCTRVEKACRRGRSTGVWQTWNFPLLLLMCDCGKAAVFLCQKLSVSRAPKKTSKGWELF